MIVVCLFVIIFDLALMVISIIEALKQKTYGFIMILINALTMSFAIAELIKELSK